MPSARPPWTTRLRAVIWWHRARDAARDQLPPALRSRRLVPVTIGALVQYLESPVGPYAEILASPVVLLERGLPAAHVPFIAVDSLASAGDGRANWALPKTLARFAWSGAAARAAAEGWSVSATTAPSGPRLPLLGLARALQLDASGRELLAPLAGLGLGRPASVEVSPAGAALPSWLLAGTHPGLVLSRARLRMGAPAVRP
ncbi:MAG: acetoacetate decarboxylase family protein [Actinomycetota bacterium]|nr:acetoacetate decarboxylase family protein [Actinomycetota bacterium]